MMFYRIFASLILIGISTNFIFADTITIFYNLHTPQHEFAAHDIKKALEGRDVTVDFMDISSLSGSFEGKKVVIALQSNAHILSILDAQNGSEVPELGEQAYALRTTVNPQMSYWIVGGDDNGAMYGGLQIAENITFRGISDTYNEEDSPYLKNRGIKFNIPLDADCPTYFYDNHGDSHKEAIRHVWDSTFWFDWFDEMARHRYNVLSLWSPHPFTAMLNMEDEYPGIAIQGVTGYNSSGNEVQINDWNIDEKVAYWQRIMEYGKNRGFDTYFCTWNIFLSTAENKHGLTDSPTNALTKAYLKKCIIKFFETYPDLKGFGVTVGERMGDITNLQKEQWAWAAYGEGVKEFALAHPERDIVFIHRQHQGDLSDIMTYFAGLNDLDNVRFDLSFKYSQAHAHTTTTPKRWYNVNMEGALSSYNLMSWLTVRNDDFYFLHWADPQFVRDYVNNFPEVDKYVNAFYIGADGWVFTRVFTSKNPYYENQNTLSVQRTWYMQKLWGRISYNPSVSTDLFKNHLSFKYPGVPTDELFNAWTAASRAVQKANEQITGAWDLDFEWWPEGWTSKDGFRTLSETTGATPFSGSSLCSIQKTAENSCGGNISAFTNADEIEQLSLDALAILESLDAGSDTELMLTLKDLEAMSNLGLYNTYKIRSAIYLRQGDAVNALSAIRTACCYWLKYTDMMDELYIGADLQRNQDFRNWHANDAKALNDYYLLGGTGTPNCRNNYPWVNIEQPLNNELFISNDTIFVEVTADGGEKEILKIELWDNGIVVDTANYVPVTFALPDLEIGNHKIEARAYDDQDSMARYSINVIVYDESLVNGVPWLEDFNLTNGTMKDEGLTSWSSTRPEGTFSVQNQTFVVNGDGNEGILTTGEIDISEGPVDISLDIRSQGGLDPTDYVKLYKIVNGGSSVLLGSITEKHESGVKIKGTAEGNSLVLEIRAKVSFSDEYYFMDNLSVTYRTQKSGQTINFPAIPVKTANDEDFFLEAVSSSGLPVTYSISDNTIAIVLQNKVHLVGAGTAIITASQAGNDFYYPAPDKTQTLTVNKADQTIVFGPLPEKFTNDPDFDPEAVSSSGLEITYASSDTTVASILNQMIHLVGEGSTIITASQPGTAIYKAAENVSQPLTVNIPVFVGGSLLNVKIYPNPVSHELSVELPDTYTLSIINVSGIELMKRGDLTGLSRLSVEGFPAGIYYAKITRENDIAVRKLMINN